MSSAQTYTPYVSPDGLKAALGIPAEDRDHDTQFTDIVLAANHEMDARLKPLLGNAPLEPDGDIFAQASRTAIRYAQSLWYERLGLLDRAKHSDEIYEKRMGALREAITASKPERTRTLFIRARDANDDRIYLPSETDSYLSRSFR